MRPANLFEHATKMLRLHAPDGKVLLVAPWPVEDRIQQIVIDHVEVDLLREVHALAF